MAEAPIKMKATQVFIKSHFFKSLFYRLSDSDSIDFFFIAKYSFVIFEKNPRLPTRN